MLTLLGNLTGLEAPTKPQPEVPEIRQTRNDPGQPRTFPSGRVVTVPPDPEPPSQEPQHGIRKRRNQ